jgi:hypothetical protein
MENGPVIDPNQKYCIVDVSLDINTHIGVIDLSLEEAIQWISNNQVQLDSPININETVFEAKYIYKSYPLI